MSWSAQMAMRREGESRRWAAELRRRGLADEHVARSIAEAYRPGPEPSQGMLDKSKAEGEE